MDFLMMFPKYRKLLRTNERLKRENKKLMKINDDLFREISRRKTDEKYNRTKKQR